MNDQPDADERGRRERRRLVLAQSDMKQAAAAADHLAASGSQMSSEVERVMWTGLVVTYARPFSKNNKLGPVSGKIVKLNDHMQRSLHGRLRDLRDELFAHNDMTELRQAVPAPESGRYGEHYEKMNPGALPDIVELAREFEGRFSARLDEIEEQQRDASL